MVYENTNVGIRVGGRAHIDICNAVAVRRYVDPSAIEAGIKERQAAPARNEARRTGQNIGGLRRGISLQRDTATVDCAVDQDIAADAVEANPGPPVLLAQKNARRAIDLATRDELKITI